MMTGRLKILAAVFLAGLAVCTGGLSSGLAADSGKVKTVRQIDVKILNVDQYAVYVPDIVFYWDDGMNKKRIAELTAIANRSRSKKVTITYLASGDATTDKRPILVDIEPFKEESKHGKPEAAAPVEAPKPDAVPPRKGPENPDYDEESDTQARQEQPPLIPSPGPQGQAEASLGIRISPITRRDANAFVQKVMGLTARKDIDGVLNSYGDQVDYYDRGRVGKDYIRKDLGAYFRNWDKIRCSLDDAVDMMDTDVEGVKLLKFTSSFYVENIKKYVMGTTANTWKIQRIGTDLKIIDEKQRVITSESQ